MTMETALRKRLLDDVAVKAIVSTRVDWSVRPQADPFPAIVLTMVSDDRSQNFEGFDKFRPTRVQIDCYAKTYAEAASLREAVIAAVVPAAIVTDTEFLRAFVNNVLDRGDQTETNGFVHRQLIDFTFWHST